MIINSHVKVVELPQLNCSSSETVQSPQAVKIMPEKYGETSYPQANRLTSTRRQCQRFSAQRLQKVSRELVPELLMQMPSHTAQHIWDA